MLQPARTKYRKMQKGRMPGTAYRGNTLTYGEFGLMALQPGWLTSRQIEAGRVAITRKPAETRMGTGKGTVEYYVAVVKPGRILYEMEGMTAEVAHHALKLAQAKMPVLTRIVNRNELSL